jgi:predicted ABC-type ATPase
LQNVIPIELTISREEIIVAVERVKLRKAAGFDEIPAEVLKNQTVIDLLFIICNETTVYFGYVQIEIPSFPIDFQKSF